MDTNWVKLLIHMLKYEQPIEGETWSHGKKFAFVA